MPTYGGTLAAARSVGERGIPVTMAGESLLAPARWSRYVTRWTPAPPVLEAERFLEWLLKFGEKNPGHVLYPTCDDLAWLIAAHSNDLGRHYRLYGPPASTILRLLDKKQLFKACQEAAIATVPTAFPSGEDAAVQEAAAIGFPLLLKPRTQVQFPSREKGHVVERAQDLRAQYRRFAKGLQYLPGVRAALPGVEIPLLQAFRSEAAQGIYSLAGFAHPSGRIVARASLKVLQRPRRLGVGLCFEEAPVDGRALAEVQRLCRAVGFFGVFEVEFVPSGGRLAMIDFNPRFYGQMAFENARELPLAWLSWLGACGEERLLSEELDRAAAWREGRGLVYCNRFFLRSMLRLQRLTGRIGPAESRRWLDWLQERRARGLAVDSVDQPGDPGPYRAGVLQELFEAARHPRSFLRSVALGQG
jgi:predicted ATP-grasp superfamily ATP-dependent carboligase